MEIYWAPVGVGDSFTLSENAVNTPVEFSVTKDSLKVSVPHLTFSYVN